MGNIKTWSQQTDANPAQIYDYEYDRADQLEFATLKNPGGTVLKRYRYDYDPAGNRAIEQIDGAVTASTFDNMNRLTAQVPGGALVFRGTTNEPATVTVATNPASTTAGNQFTGSVAVASGTTNVAVKATDPNGNIRTNTYQVSESGATKNFTYDPNGNLTGDGTKTYIWDGADRLVEVKQGATSLAAFNYNGRGLRGNKIVGGASITYIYDGQNFLEERPNAGVTIRYVYGLGIDDALAQVVGSTPSYYLTDHLGSVVRLTENAGNAAVTREYDPWGSLLQGSGTSGYAFSGREWDAEIGLNYQRARFYVPSIGRWASEDPLAMQPGAPIRFQLGKFQYVGNRPTVETDRLGLATDCRNPCQAKNISNGDAGGVVCCDGVKWACAWAQLPPTAGTVAARTLRTCSTIHEVSHWKDIECPCEGISRGMSSNAKASECAAYTKSVACVLRLRPQCNGDRICEYYVDDMLRQWTNLRNANCAP